MPEEQAVPVTYSFFRTDLGLAVVARRRTEICALLLGDCEAELLSELQSRFPGVAVVAGGEALDLLVEEDFGAAQVPSVVLAPQGTEFQQAVWAELRRIPAGERITYRELARRLGRPQAVRACASACAANPIAVLIPCHRVVRSDGGLGGYRWGLHRKQALLAREALIKPAFGRSRLSGTSLRCSFTTVNSAPCDFRSTDLELKSELNQSFPREGQFVS